MSQPSRSMILPDISTQQTTNLIINLDHDEWILGDDATALIDAGFGESLSFIQRCWTTLVEN